MNLKTAGLSLAVVLCSAAAGADPVQPPPGDHPVLGQIAAAVSAEQLRGTIQALVGFGTRHTLSDTQSEARGIGAARRWTKARFEAISRDCGGCLSIVTPSQTVSGKRIPTPTEVMDVVAIQKGSTEPDRVIVLTAHIDSRVSDVMNASADAPGADDNGSGTALVIETARILSRYRFPATIVYGVLSGEEQGLYGGKVLAQYAHDQNWKVEADLNDDIVGATHGQNGVVDNTRIRLFSEGTREAETAQQARLRRYEGGEIDGPSRNVARTIKDQTERYIPNWRVDLVYRVDRFGRGSDHEAFNELGYPAVCFRESAEDYRHQHQDLRTENGMVYGDTIDHVDFDYLARVTATNAIGAAGLAWAPPPPDGLKIAGGVSPDTTVSWQPLSGAAAKTLAGYRIHWRDTTAAAWSHSRWVGTASEVKLDGVVIDDWAFGVASVSTDGFESPVESPGPVGAFWPAPEPVEEKK